MATTLATTAYVVRRYEIENIYQRRVVPLIAEASFPRDKEKLKTAYENGLKIIEKSFTFSHPSEVKEYKDFLNSMIRNLDA